MACHVLAVLGGNGQQNDLRRVCFPRPAAQLERSSPSPYHIAHHTTIHTHNVPILLLYLAQDLNHKLNHKSPLHRYRQFQMVYRSFGLNQRQWLTIIATHRCFKHVATRASAGESSPTSATMTPCNFHKTSFAVITLAPWPCRGFKNPFQLPTNTPDNRSYTADRAFDVVQRLGKRLASERALESPFHDAFVIGRIEVATVAPRCKI